MLSKTYDAPISAGAPEDKVREAAEELADHENRLPSIDNQLAVMNGHFAAIEGRFEAIDGRFAGINARLSALEGKLSVVMWAVGINAATTIAILGVLLHRPRWPHAGDLLKIASTAAGLL